jgi:Rieske Fe-S protein
MEDQPKPTRRSFVNWFLGTSTGALMASIALPVLRFMSPPRVPEAATQEVEAGSTHDPELLEKGFKIVRFGAEPVILIRASESEFYAFSATCTHLDCIVEYRPGIKKIWCNCHDGQYDLAGRNVGGPPPRPLAPYNVHVVSKGAGPGTLVVSKA